MESSDEIMMFYGRCRCCLEYGYLKSMWKEHTWEDEREIYGEMLMETFNLAWESNSSDEHICETCVIRLRDAFHFKKEVISAEQLLEERLDHDEEMDEEHLFKYSPNSEEHEDDAKYDEVEVKAEYGEIAVKTECSEVEVKADYGEIEFLEEDAEIVEQSVSTYVEKDADSERRTKIKLPPRKRGERTSYRKYTQSDLKKCIEAIQTQGLSQSEAARLFNIPTKTVNVKMSKLQNRSDDGESDTQEDKRTVKKHRDNIRTILEYTNATPIKGHKGVGFMCYFCTKQYPKAADLKRHTYTHKDIAEKVNFRVLFNFKLKLDLTGLKCKICREDIDDLNLEEAMDHLKNHNKVIHKDIKNHIIPFKLHDENFKCLLCDEAFSYFNLLSAHMSEHYANYLCKVCCKGFITKHATRSHSYRHDVGEYPCRVCDKTFLNKQRRQTHERVVHVQRNKTQKCSYCNEKFVDVVQKANHEVSIHGAKLKQFVCQYCDKIYLSQRSLTAHIKRCHLLLRPHKCGLCEKRFFKKSALTRHMVTHTGERAYECDICGKCFGTRGTLKAHFKTH